MSKNGDCAARQRKSQNYANVCVGCTSARLCIRCLLRFTILVVIISLVLNSRSSFPAHKL
jgi:hypothetical protein